MSKVDGLKVDVNSPYHKTALDNHTEYWVTHVGKTEDGLVFRQRLVYTLAEAKKYRKFLRTRDSIKRKSVTIWKRKVKYSEFQKLK